MYYHSPSFWPARLIPAPRRELAQSGVGGVRHVKPRRPSSRRWSTKEGRPVLSCLPDGGLAPPGKTGPGRASFPQHVGPERQGRVSDVHEPHRCRPRLQRCSCLLCRLAHITPPTSHPTTHHLQERSKPPRTQNTQPPTKRLTSEPHMSAPNRTITRTDPAARYQPAVLHDPCLEYKPLRCGLPTQHKQSRGDL